MICAWPSDFLASEVGNLKSLSSLHSPSRCALAIVVVALHQRAIFLGCALVMHNVSNIGRPERESIFLAYVWLWIRVRRRQGIHQVLNPSPKRWGRLKLSTEKGLHIDRGEATSLDKEVWCCRYATLAETDATAVNAGVRLNGYWGKADWERRQGLCPCSWHRGLATRLTIPCWTQHQGFNRRD